MKTRIFAAPLMIALLIVLTACSTSSQAEADEPVQTQQQADDHAAHHPEGRQAEAEQTEDKHQMMAKMCPMQVEGTTRQLVKLDDAVAMEFTTTSDVSELRRRVERMAQMHERMHGEDGHMHGHMHGKMQHGERHEEMTEEMTEEKRQMHRQMMQRMADVTVETEEIEGGMRVKFTPDDAAQVDELHQMMEQHTHMMDEEGHCPMMHMMGGEQ